MGARRRLAAVLVVLGATMASCGGDAAPVGDPLARLAAALDVVEVSAGDVVTYRPGEVGEALGDGDGVRTGQPGYAEVGYRDGSITRVSESTQFTVRDVATEAEAPQVEVDLDVGRAWNRVATTEDGTFTVTTDVGTAAVRGTAFDVDCRDPAGTGCVVTVVEGSVGLSGTAGDSVELAAVQRVQVAPDGTLGEVADLTLAEVRGDAWIASNLDRDAARGFPALAPAADDGTGVVAEPVGWAGGAELRASEVEPGEDGEIVQRVVAGGPRRVTLSWSYCNPQVCGTSENIVCAAGWNPRYGGALMQEVVLQPPAGHELVRATVGLGRTGADTSTVGALGGDGGWQGATGQFATAPALTEAGGIRFVLEANGLESTFRRLPDFPDRPCGISDERREEILAEFGSTVELDVATVVVTATWRPAGGEPPAESAEQVVRLAGKEQRIQVALPPAPDRVVVAGAPVFTQDDERWADSSPLDGAAEPAPGPADGATGATAGSRQPPRFGEVGTVPTALANVLVRLGHDVDPVTVGTRLWDLGAWTPGRGTDLRPLRVDGGLDLAPLLEGTQQTAPRSGLVDALGELATGRAVGLAALADGGTRGMVALVGWDPEIDAVTVLHPVRGEVPVGLGALADQLVELWLARPPAPGGAA